MSKCYLGHLGSSWDAAHSNQNQNQGCSGIKIKIRGERESKSKSKSAGIKIKIRVRRNYFLDFENGNGCISVLDSLKEDQTVKKNMPHSGRYYPDQTVGLIKFGQRQQRSYLVVDWGIKGPGTSRQAGHINIGTRLIFIKHFAKVYQKAELHGMAIGEVFLSCVSELLHRRVFRETSFLAITVLINRYSRQLIIQKLFSTLFDMMMKALEVLI